ncbi:protein SSUH2, partial [Caerostris extrusa]
QYVDGPTERPSSRTVGYQIHHTEMFQDCQIKLKFPHTAYVKECGRCVWGTAESGCDSCYGRGGTTCISCSGVGRRNGQQCTSCFGTGRRRCWNCSGTGQVKCGTCDGRGNLRHFRLLIVTWKNHVESYITPTSKLPKQLILEVTGKELFKEQNLRVYPINHATDISVNGASKHLVEKHATAFPQEFIRQQRHTLQAVPLVKAKVCLEKKTGRILCLWIPEASLLRRLSAKMLLLYLLLM